MRSRLHWHSLRVRLVVLVSILSAALALSFLLIYPSHMAQRASEVLEHRIKSVAKLIIANIEPAIDFMDSYEAGRALINLGDVPGAVYGVILSQRGELIAAWRLEEAPLPLGAHRELVRSTDGHMHVRSPITTRGGTQATLLLGFSRAEIDASRTRALRSAALIAALVWLSGTLAAFAIGTVLVRPLRQVTRVARRITAGESAARRELMSEGQGESGELIAAVTQMLDHLFEQRAIATALTCELEHCVAERTYELARTNSELERRLAELRDTQEQLITADRRLSMGTLTAGVAHEINNPLTYVYNNVSYVRDELTQMSEKAAAERRALTLDSETHHEMVNALADAISGCERVSFIVRSLKDFSRGDDGSREAVDVCKAMESAIAIADNQIRHRATLVRQYEEVPRVLANEIRLGQVFLNLLLNACQAIAAGSAEQNRIAVSIGEDERGHVRVSVRDTGCGMTPEVRRRIFSPFYTTKPVGVGTGLGLSICHGIVSSLGGTIDVDTAPGEGSTFTVVLPKASADHIASAAATAASCGHTPSTSRRLLVVDDDPRVCLAIERTVGESLDMTAMTSARDALSTLRSGERYDAILCDLMMPDMTGMDLFAELERSMPTLCPRVLFFTGGVFTEEGRAFTARHAGRCLQKPIAGAELKRRLAALWE